LTTNENANHIFVNYKLKEWTFTTGMYWLGMPSDYKTKSLPESLVNYSRHNQIWNNKSMFVLGLSYDFSKGKKTEIDKKLNNSTAPAATFKIIINNKYLLKFLRKTLLIQRNHLIQNPAKDN
jgi:hypothetical protein